MENKQAIWDAIQAIDKMAELFYQQKEKHGMEQLNETINKIGLAMNEIFLIKQLNKNIMIEEEIINQYLNLGMDALANKDYILLSDIFLYDLSEQFQNVLTNLN